MKKTEKMFLEIMYGNPDAYKRGYEQGKKDAWKDPDRFEQFSLRQYWIDKTCIATLERVLKEVKILGYAGNSDIVKWLEQHLKEAKGE